MSQQLLNAPQRQLIVESHSQDVKQTHVVLVKRPEQQQREKMRNSLQIRDTNTPFLLVPASRSVPEIPLELTWEQKPLCRCWRLNAGMSLSVYILHLFFYLLHSLRLQTHAFYFIFLTFTLLSSLNSNLLLFLSESRLTADKRLTWPWSLDQRSLFPFFFFLKKKKFSLISVGHRFCTLYSFTCLHIKLLITRPYCIIFFFIYTPTSVCLHLP